MWGAVCGQLLLEKLADAWGTEPPPDLTEGNTRDLRCPECGNGTHDEKAFSVTVSEDAIVWHCFRASCGFSGGVSVLGGPRASPDGGAAAVDAMDAMNEAAKKAHGVFATSSIADAAWQEEQRKVRPYLLQSTVRFTAWKRMVGQAGTGANMPVG